MTLTDWIIQVSITAGIAVVLHFVIGFVAKRLQARAHNRGPVAASLPSSMSLPLRTLLWSLAAVIIVQACNIEFVWGISPLVFSKARRLIIVICLAWLVSRWKGHCVASYKNKPAVQQGQASLVGKVVGLAAFVVSLLLILQILGVDIRVLVTLSGFGSIAIGFAGKDVFANFFGGMMLHITRPFKVGQYVTSPDRTLDGHVEQIGWYLTRIRALDKRPIFVPNSIFSNVVVMNGTSIYNRRIQTTLGLRYQDLSLVPVIVEELQKMMDEHPELKGEWPPVVRFSGYEAYSLSIFVRAYTTTTPYSDFMTLQQSVLLKCGEIVHRYGADFAFPTTTIDVVPLGGSGLTEQSQ